MSSINPSVPNDIENDGCWINQHTRFLCQTKAREPDVVLIGDSVIKMMQYSTSYKKYLEPLHCLNFGICDDKVENILWRIENAELDGVSPKIIIMHAGTDCNGSSANDIVDGIEVLISKIKLKQPNSTIIILGMMPCGRDDNPRRKKHASINEMLSTIYGKDKVSQTVLLLPDWENMIQADGTLSHRDLYDYLHPTDQGYSKLIELLLDELHVSLPNSTSFLKVTMSALSVNSDAGGVSSDAASAGGDSS